MEFINWSFLVDTFFVALSGVPIALLVTVVSLFVAVPLGFLLALARVYELPVINVIAKIYISFVRGTPVIIQIFVLYATIPLLLNGLFEKYHIDYPIYDINPIWYAFIIFSFNTAAVLIEVFRSALQTVSKGQLEAAHSVGLTTAQAYRRIIIPQMLVSAMPNLCTATINLIKATSLGYAISLQEITLKAKVEANFGYNYLEAYIDIFVVYLIVCIIVEKLFKWYEKHLSRYKVAVA
ncbi:MULTISPECIES: amino acid ABC transporter permease [unclassified Lysinibacillus]|uniref:amino acid ABC transporter permease n=1 Tax=unclassified Lysinibacillus TaxID=2636778 RepID=UPI001F10B1C6|nr:MULTISPECIES: amino acid ABC transporter permease [unclassified Lysinibacillus]